MRVLHAILDEAAEYDPKANDKRRRQRRLQAIVSSMGAARVALSMASCEDGLLCEAGLQLGIGLLRGGNAEVQSQMYDELTRSFDGVEAYDGGGIGYFEMMKRRLRIAMREAPEVKLYRSQQADRLDDFELEQENLSPATRVAMRKQLEKEFESDSNVASVLEFMRLLCEGHNLKLQDLLREQTAEMTSVDLISEVNELLLVIETEIDQHNLEQASQCIEALTEFTQGVSPDTGRSSNSELLLETKLIEVLDRLVQKRSIDGVFPSDLSNLRGSVARLLMALLEGTDRGAETRMLLRLDLVSIARQCGNLYRLAMGAADLAATGTGTDADLQRSITSLGAGRSNMEQTKEQLEQQLATQAAAVAAQSVQAVSTFTRDAGTGAVTGVLKQLAIKPMQEDQLTPEQQAALDAGFELFTLLRHLLDFLEQEEVHHDGVQTDKRVREAIEEESLKEALDYYARSVGSCEIINVSGSLERVFFRFPSFCLCLSDERRHRLVWNELDRETPGAQLRDFIMASEELHFEMKHEASLNKYAVNRPTRTKSLHRLCVSSFSHAAADPFHIHPTDCGSGGCSCSTSRRRSTQCSGLRSSRTLA